ncbi:aminotransferase class IV [Halomicronema sp. CCY15110]|uniref:aminotransferase class IV n=1 Tax=Halomicronema sp. CCY15110 TaxID=2767773 RepID=UPI001EF2058E|nr:aminotransferase class IV [Halomicronema sp. CCY15110]
MPMSEAQSTNRCHWYAGQLVTGDTLMLSMHDPGLLFGATVFTTLRIYENDLDHPWTAWPSHCQRVARSLQAFHWSAPDWTRVRQGAAQLASAYPVLRVTIFPDGRELIVGRSLPPHLQTWQTQGVTAWVADSPDFQRSLPDHKTGNYLACWLALQAAQRAQAQAAILIDAQGHWLETSTGNLWGWVAGQWYTPPLAGAILPGVLRSRLMQGLQVQHQVVQTCPWDATQVSQFTYLAYTNSVMAVVPIHTVLQGNASVNYNPDQGKTQQLTKAWQAGAQET